MNCLEKLLNKCENLLKDGEEEPLSNEGKSTYNGESINKDYKLLSDIKDFDDKVYCSQCAFHMETDYGSSKCKNNVFTKIRFDSVYGVLNIYPLCTDINQNGECEYFQQHKNWIVKVLEYILKKFQ